VRNFLHKSNIIWDCKLGHAWVLGHVRQDLSTQCFITCVAIECTESTSWKHKNCADVLISCVFQKSQARTAQG
jgi:hypothetical protein